MADFKTIPSVNGINVSLENHTHDDIDASNSLNIPSTIVKRDESGNFSANVISANLSGNASTATKLATVRSISLSGDVTGSTNFDGSGNVTIAATVANNSHNHTSANISDATNANTANTIVKRDESGNFSAGAITATSFHTAGTSRIGNHSVAPEHIELNNYNTGDRYTYLNFHSDDINTDYSFRIIRNPGVNGGATIAQKGTGNLVFKTENSADLQFFTNNTLILSLQDNYISNFEQGKLGIKAAPSGDLLARNACLSIGDSDTGIAQNGDGVLELWTNNNPVAVFNPSGDCSILRYGTAQYFAMTHGTSTRNSDTVFYSSTDNYIRKNDKNGFISSLGLDLRYIESHFNMLTTSSITYDTNDLPTTIVYTTGNKKVITYNDDRDPTTIEYYDTNGSSLLKTKTLTYLDGVLTGSTWS